MACEVDCDNCGGYAEGNNVKQICIHCFNNTIKEIKKLRRKIKKLEDSNGIKD